MNCELRVWNSQLVTRNSDYLIFTLITDISRIFLLRTATFYYIAHHLLFISCKFYYLDTALLWQKIKKGDKNAFNQLFKLYYMDLKAYGVKIAGQEADAKEAIQLLFVKIWEKRATLNEVKSVKSYLLTAYRRTLIDLLAAEKKQTQVTDNTPTFTIAPSELQIFQQDKKIQATRLAELLHQLPAKQKEIIYLRFYNQLSYLEIAEIIDLNYQSVRNYSVKAIRFLRKNWPH